MKKIVLSLVLLIAACSDPSLPSEASQRESAHREISWFDGTLQEAFAFAKKNDKPLILYWGAKWCPPCNQLKATVFKRPDFIAKSALFVPVYLNGDEQSAQKHGERFGVRGYPTLILFNPRGEEITRIPGGLELERYVAVLDLALKSIKPASELWRDAQRGVALNDSDISLLAYYSWGQDNHRVTGDTKQQIVFKTLMALTPDHMPVEKSRFVVLYLQSLVASEQSFSRDSAAIFHARKLLKALLLSNDQVAANLSFLIYDDGDVLGSLYPPEADVAGRESFLRERAEVVELWNQQLLKHRDNKILSISERVGTVYGQVWLSQLYGKQLDESLVQRVVATVEWADKTALTSYQRQAVINIAYSLLVTADMSDRAELLLKKELSKSESPFYWMSDLAELSKNAGRIDEALRWLEKAYRDSHGSATRFQWGVNYVLGLLEMAPEDGQVIELATLEVLGELAAQRDPVHGRNSKRVSNLGREFTKWNIDVSRRRVVDKLRVYYAQICADSRSNEQDISDCVGKFI